MADEADRVREAAAPLAAARDVDLVDVAIRGRGSGRLVRVVIDRKGGVDLATCHALSRDLSAALDKEDPVAGRYSLEVTSPGVDHPLRDRAAFDRVEGRGVLVHRRASEEETAEQVRGTVLRAGADSVVLDVHGREVSVPYFEIVTAKQTLPW